VQAKKFPVFYGTRRLITMFTGARHRALSWATLIHSIPLRCTVALSHLCLTPNVLFPSSFPTKLVCIFVSPSCATSSTHRILLALTTLITSGDECKLWSSSLWTFLYLSVSSSVINPNNSWALCFNNILTVKEHINLKIKTELHILMRSKKAPSFVFMLSRAQGQQSSCLLLMFMTLTSDAWDLQSQINCNKITVWRVFILTAQFCSSQMSP
jgi:hypothetical protein